MSPKPGSGLRPDSIFAGPDRSRSVCFFATSLIGLALVVVLVTSLLSAGCATTGQMSVLPNREQLVSDQLLIHSDFDIPRHHRLVGELTARRHDISETLGIPMSDEPINVFLFEDRQKFREFMDRSHPEFPDRRAFFVKNDTSLNVYAYWGPRVGEDLRHEVTHGYLHSVVPNIPLWLDEGIAEYFEVWRGKGGLNGPHVYSLSNSFERGQWKPNLTRLELIGSAGQLSQMDYAESWLWVHFLLSGDPDSLDRSRPIEATDQTGRSETVLPMIASRIPDYENQLIMHLKVSAGNLNVAPKQ